MFSIPRIRIPRIRWGRVLATSLVGVLVTVSAVRFEQGQWGAITLGPRTFYFEEPSIATRVHEAVHRQQFRESGVAGLLRYVVDHSYRLDVEAEAAAGAYCVRYHRPVDFSEVVLSTSIRQAASYRTWAWEPEQAARDRVGEQFADGLRCADILAGLELDLPPGKELDWESRVQLYAFRFFREYGSDAYSLREWKERVRLSRAAAPGPVLSRSFEKQLPLIARARTVALPADSAIPPRTAGAALQRLLFSQPSTDTPPTAEAARQGAAFWSPPPFAKTDGSRRAWDWGAPLVVEALSGKLDPSAVRWLLGRKDREALDLLEQFALAPAADILGTRYTKKTLRTVGLSALPPSPEHLGHLRSVLQGHAALEIARGETMAAERLLRLAVNLDVRVAEDSPFRGDAAAALSGLAQTLSLLDRFLVSQPPMRHGMSPLLVHMEGEPSFFTPSHWRSLGEGRAEELYRDLPLIAGDTLLPRAVRWSAFRGAALYEACLARHPHPRVRDLNEIWRDAVTEDLARHPGDKVYIESVRSEMSSLIAGSGVDPLVLCPAPENLRPLRLGSLLARRDARLQGSGVSAEGPTARDAQRPLPHASVVAAE